MDHSLVPSIGENKLKHVKFKVLIFDLIELAWFIIVYLAKCDVWIKYHTPLVI